LTRSLETLTVEEVLNIHELLAADFVESHDPISPPGVRSSALLESAVHRQWSSHGGRLKYPDAIPNAATLVFGICCDHPFHNGNKRCALVAMLAHLDRNGLCLYGVSQKDLYLFMLSVADHTIGLRGDPRRHDGGHSRRRADDQVDAISGWLKRRVQEVKRGDKPIAFRNLRQILVGFGFEFGTISSNKVEVMRVEIQKPSLLRREAREVRRRVGWIGYRDEGTDVSVKDLKDIRRMCYLTEADGVDSDAFYNGTAVVDSFVNRYRTVLRRLART
jgi:death-on-curing protein